MRAGRRADVLSLSPGGLEHGGGIGRMTGYMLDALRERPGAPVVEVVDTRGPGRLSVAPLFFARALARVAAAAATSRPLLHVHVAGRGSTLRKVILVHLAALLRLRTVLHLHDYDYGRFLDSLPRWTRPAVRSTFRRAGAVVVLGSADRALVTERFGLDPARVVTAPNAVPRPPAARAERDGSGVRILFLGDPSRRKGVHDLLAALERLEADPGPPAWTAVLAGGGRELDGFRRQVEASPLLAGRVDLPGWVDRDRAHALLAGADVLVLPSYAEGLAMSVLEGMAHGLCVVATPVGALAEALRDGEDALLVRPGDVEGLAAVLRRAVADPGLRARLGAAARARFAERYDARGYPDRILPAYALARG